MKIRIFPAKAAMAQAAAEQAAATIREAIAKRGEARIIAATGASQFDFLEALTGVAGIDWKKVEMFHLDEYVGLTPGHPCSYRRFMDEELFSHINMKETSVPLGSAPDLQAETQRYDAMIEQAGGIDIQLLGLGQNGHIGFNEPDRSFSYGTQVVTLTKNTIKANRRFFGSEEDVPRQAISLGIGGIMKARQIVLIAYGISKAQAVRDMIKGPVDPMCPASVLQLHPDTVILLDAQAASLL